MRSTERKYPTDKPWAFISPSAARTGQGRAQCLACKSDSYFSSGAHVPGPCTLVGQFLLQRGFSEC